MASQLTTHASHSGSDREFPQPLVSACCRDDRQRRRWTTGRTATRRGFSPRMATVSSALPCSADLMSVIIEFGYDIHSDQRFVYYEYGDK